MDLFVCNACGHKMTDVVFSSGKVCPKCTGRAIRKVDIDSKKESEMAQKRLSERLISKKTVQDNDELYKQWKNYIKNRTR